MCTVFMTLLFRIHVLMYYFMYVITKLGRRFLFRKHRYLFHFDSFINFHRCFKTFNVQKR